MAACLQVGLLTLHTEYTARCSAATRAARDLLALLSSNDTNRQLLAKQGDARPPCLPAVLPSGGRPPHPEIRGIGLHETLHDIPWHHGTARFAGGEALLRPLSRCRSAIVDHGRVCAACGSQGSPTIPLLLCSGCRATFYCSRQCARENRAHHKVSRRGGGEARMCHMPRRVGWSIVHMHRCTAT